MNSQRKTLLLYWERNELYSFFRQLFQSIQDNLLSDDDINYFIDKLNGSYPIKNVMDFNLKGPRELIKALGIEKTDNLQFIDRKILTHFMQYVFSELKDGNL